MLICNIPDASKGAVMKVRRDGIVSLSVRQLQRDSSILQSAVSAGASGASRNFARRATRYYALHYLVAGQQGFKQLTAIRSTVDGVQAFGDHNSFFCDGTRTPIQALFARFTLATLAFSMCWIWWGLHVWVWFVL